MAASSNVVSLPNIATNPSTTKTSTRRSISPQAGRALDLLAHAIEYLADQHILRTDDFRANDPDVQAIQLLMTFNRQVYFECPLVPSFSDRLRALFNLRTT